MRISTLFYTIRQGFRNAFRNKLFTLASVATIAACLFLFGLFYSIMTNFTHIIKTAQEGISVTVFFDEGLDANAIENIGILIEEREEVDHVVFESADEAWEKFKTDYLGEYADGFTENPLADSANYQIYLNDISMQPSLVAFLETVEGIRQINQSEVTATTLTGVNALVAYVSIGIIVILFAVSVFLISNTVMLGISVRKEEIGIMKYIGATDFFVRAPFVVEGILIGVIGAAIPLAAIYYLYNIVIEYVNHRFSMLSQLLHFLTVQEIYRILLPVTLAIGVGIGFLGSYTTVRKHLRV